MEFNIQTTFLILIFIIILSIIGLGYLEIKKNYQKHNVQKKRTTHVKLYYLNR